MIIISKKDVEKSCEDYEYRCFSDETQRIFIRTYASEIIKRT